MHSDFWESRLDINVCWNAVHHRLLKTTSWAISYFCKFDGFFLVLGFRGVKIVACEGLLLVFELKLSPFIGSSHQAIWHIDVMLVDYEINFTFTTFMIYCSHERVHI